jgi:glycosyltransferase involved in cell wall biosynthesis
VHDDASTDGSAAIIREYEEKYPNIIKPIYETENQYSKHDGSLGRIMNAAIDATGAKYVAMCEGDDYWTDPLKLQKQVDFLEEYTDYSVTFHRCKHYNVVDETIKDDQCGFLFQNNEEGVDVTVEMFFDKWITQPLTMIYRASLFDLDDMLKYKYYRDMHQIYHLLINGKGYLFGFEGGIYRVTGNGIFSSMNLAQECSTVAEVFKELYHYNKNNIIFNKYVSALKWAANTLKRNKCYRFLSFKYAINVYVHTFDNKFLLKYFIK